MYRVKIRNIVTGGEETHFFHTIFELSEYLVSKPYHLQLVGVLVG